MSPLTSVLARQRLLVIPILAFALPYAASASSPDDIHWDSRFGGANGPDRGVHAITIDGSNVYIGGEFRAVAGISTIKVARWDGVQWYAMSGDVDLDDHYVAALAMWNGDLYAGGTFLSLDGVPANRIARWNGTGWSALGAGSTGAVYAIAPYNGQLYAGGVGGVNRWDGTNWTSVATLTGFAPFVIKILPDGSDLYVGGTFTTIGGVTASHIARWDGVAWNPLPAVLTGSCGNRVNDIVNTPGGLYVGGLFHRETGEPEALNDVARWDGSDWKQVGAGGVEHTPLYMCDDAFVFAVAQYDGDVVYGGAWDTVDGQALPNLVRWDGSTWSAIGTSPNGSAIDLYVNGQTLYVGGGFTQIGGKPSNNFAIYDPAIATGVGGNPSISFRLEQNSPNPFNPQTQIRYALPRASRVRLEVVDVSGRLVRTLFDRHVPAGSHTAMWDGRDREGNPSASGVYFFRLTDGTHTQVRKGVLLK